MSGQAVKFEFRLDKGEFAALTAKLRKLSGSHAGTYIARALNKTATSGRKTLAEKAQETHTVQKGGFNKDMHIKNATAGNLVAKIEAEGETLNVHYFKWSPNGGSRRGMKPVQNDIVKGGMKDRSLNGNKAFVIKVGRVKYNKKTGQTEKVMKKNRKTGQSEQATASLVFARTGRSRTPIWVLKGPSVPGMLGSKRVWVPSRGEIESDLKKYMKQQINLLLK